MAKEIDCSLGKIIEITPGVSKLDWGEGIWDRFRELNREDFEANIKPIFNRLEQWRKESASKTEPVVKMGTKAIKKAA